MRALWPSAPSKICIPSPSRAPQALLSPWLLQQGAASVPGGSQGCALAVPSATYRSCFSPAVLLLLRAVAERFATRTAVLRVGCPCSLEHGCFRGQAPLRRMMSAQVPLMAHVGFLSVSPSTSTVLCANACPATRHVPGCSWAIPPESQMHSCWPPLYQRSLASLCVPLLCVLPCLAALELVDMDLAAGKAVTSPLVHRKL